MNMTDQGDAPHNLTHKQLKAMAKASRPWYRKKRFMALGGFGVIIAVAAGTSGRSSTPSPSKINGVESVSSNGDNPPQADVELTMCEAGEFGPDISVKVVNHSSKRSDYSFQVNVLAADGTKIGEGFGSSRNVEAGQTALEDVFATAKDGLAECVLTDVNRFASN